ncbi:putative FMNH2-dependent monooxygenase SfnC [Methylophilaceae bacterium]|nr:putative FMNH2-dependent monooxygenase SfnC [Methylophilaceae bacterium]
MSKHIDPVAAASIPDDRISLANGIAKDTRAAVVSALLEDLASTAVQRDKSGGTAKRERDLIRQSGLLLLTIPESLGGAGSDLNETLNISRQIAAVDSSLAHLFAFHHFMLATLQFFSPESQWKPLFEQTVQHQWFWGNALNPLDKRTSIVPGKNEGEYFVNGSKSFCSGATDSDMLVVSAVQANVAGLVIAAIPTTRQGITVHDDWDNIGQRQTDSGGVSFEQVALFDSEILRSPGPLGSPFASLRSCLGQLILTNIYLGIAEGALAQAAGYVNANVQPWWASRAESVGEDPLVLRNFGEYWVEVAGARALTDLAQQRFQTAFNLGDDVNESIRGETAISIATAKVASARAVLNVSSRIFEVLGARATTAKFGFDRFWRNARTHSLHDPLDYKLLELGAWSLSKKIPEPSFYS